MPLLKVLPRFEYTLRAAMNLAEAGANILLVEQGGINIENTDGGGEDYAIEVKG